MPHSGETKQGASYKERPGHMKTKMKKPAKSFGFGKKEMY